MRKKQSKEQKQERNTETELGWLSFSTACQIRHFYQSYCPATYMSIINLISPCKVNAHQTTHAPSKRTLNIDLCVLTVWLFVWQLVKKIPQWYANMVAWLNWHQYYFTSILFPNQYWHGILIFITKTTNVIKWSQIRWGWYLVKRFH